MWIMAAPFILCLPAFLSAFCKPSTALSKFCQCLPKQSPSRYSPAAPLAWLGTTPERTDRQTDPTAPGQLPWLLTVTPPQPPSSSQLYFLVLPQMEKVVVYKGLGPGPWITLSYLQRAFKINPASLRSAVSVNWTGSRGKGIWDFETVWVNCYWNRWNVNENKVNFVLFYI